MASHVFQQVDVFTATAFKGNPLAVVVGADHLTDQQMATIANWTNLSETAFLLQPTDPGADYRVRIFTPERELPFAGHPTLGSCHVWLATGHSPKSDPIVQECRAGLVRIKRDGARLALQPHVCNGAATWHRTFSVASPRGFGSIRRRSKPHSGWTMGRGGWP